MQQNGDSFYTRYCRMGRKFELSGGVTLAAAVIGYMTSGGNAFLTVMGIIGALLLVFGAANMRPNNQIKAFAQQLTTTPDRDFAQGLLDAMEKNGKTLLSGRAISNVEQAILVYARSKEADAKMVEALKAAVGKHIRKMPF
jgi:hypothetical protein